VHFFQGFCSFKGFAAAAIRTPAATGKESAKTCARRAAALPLSLDLSKLLAHIRAAAVNAIARGLQRKTMSAISHRIARSLSVSSDGDNPRQYPSWTRSHKAAGREISPPSRHMDAAE
jgi:hypothetical protein